jgi:hypothetical protein
VKISRSTLETIVLFALLGGVAFYSLLLLGQCYDANDLLFQFAPWRHFLKDSLAQGIIPLWNPYSFCGQPFFADLQTQMLYPPNWLTLLPSIPTGMNGFIRPPLVYRRFRNAPMVEKSRSFGRLVPRRRASFRFLRLFLVGNHPPTRPSGLRVGPLVVCRLGTFHPSSHGQGRLVARRFLCHAFSVRQFPSHLRRRLRRGPYRSCDFGKTTVKKAQPKVQGAPLGFHRGCHSFRAAPSFCRN